ncbi:MAG TPA: MBL fold metallo-hydrolase [Allosphingosinicella sp.]
MIRLLKTLGTALLFLAIGACFLPTLLPPFLDRIYYEGSESGHYDGERFFNPLDRLRQAERRKPNRFFSRWLTGEGRARWPDQVPVTPTKPPARVEGQAMKVTWIGHATVLVQTAGLNILTDPIWSDRASPFSFTGPKRVRAPGVHFENLPKIDLVVVSHNHYDHMDLPTLKRLWDRDRPVIVTSLGNDTILKGRGIGAAALDWDGKLTLPSGAAVRVERNHHWSSRWFSDRNRALWSAFTIILPSGNVFFAGDTGYGDGGWAREAAAHGPYRLAILPIGAYEPREVMKNSHINPEEAMRVYRTLGAKSGLGIHWGTFQLTFEPIGEPLERLAKLRREAGPEGAGFIATEAGRTWDVPPL